MVAINVTSARKRLFELIQQVNDDAEAVEVTSKRGNAFLVPEAEYRAMRETAYLLSSPRNAKRLAESIVELDSGQGHAFESVERLRAETGQ